VATCNQYFWASDEDGNPVPFAIDFILRKNGAPAGAYTIPQGGYRQLVLEVGAYYEAAAVTGRTGWITPDAEKFTGCPPADINFVYEREPEPEPPTVIIDVRVVDQNYAIVVGSQVTIPEALGAKTIATNMSGVAVGFTLTEGVTFTATAAPPNGYTSDPGSTGSDVASGSMTITRTLTKIPPPVLVDVLVVDQDNAVVAGSHVTIPGALGATTIATNMSGIAVGFTLVKDQVYTATAAPPNGYTSDSGSTGSFTATQSGTITRTLTKTIPPIICVPSISDLSLPTIPLTLTNGVPGIGTVAQITFEADMSCLQDGAPVLIWYPFPAVSRIEGDVDLQDGTGDAVESTVTVIEGTNTIDIGPALTVLLLTGKIDINTRALPYKLAYPSEIVDGVPSSELETIEDEIELVPPVPIICIPSLTDLTSPDSIMLEPPSLEGGLPTLGPVTDPVTFVASMSCTKGGTPVEDQFPFYVNFYLAGGMIGQLLVVAGTNTIPAATLTSAITAAIAAGAITLDMDSFEIEIAYPSEIVDGVPGEYTSVTDTISIALPGPVICLPNIDLLSLPVEVPLTFPAPGDPGLPSLPVTPTPLPIKMTLAVPQCLRNSTEMADPVGLFPIPVELYLIDMVTPFVTLNRYSEGAFEYDILNFIRANLGEIQTLKLSSIGVKIRFPNRIDFASPGSIVSYNEITGSIPIVPTFLEPIPPCVLTEADFFTCPDGTVIQINECVNGVKVPTGETCPIPPVPECVLTEFDFFTCPDGTVIQINECVNGVKVPTGQTCPVAPPVCVLTEFDFFTCPDGTVIQINECVNGVKVPIIPPPTCPPVVPPVEPPPVVPQQWYVLIAAPDLVYAGRDVTITAMALCAGVESTGDPATLKIDGVAVETKYTAAGEVSFTWLAEGVGDHIVCVELPAKEACPLPGGACKSIRVVTYLPEVEEQVRTELEAYESGLAKLRRLREIERDRLRGVRIPSGTIKVPSSLAGSTVVIGGIPRVVPPEGISITVPAGEEIVTIITDGVRKVVPVPVLPGEIGILPGV